MGIDNEKKRLRRLFFEMYRLKRPKASLGNLRRNLQSYLRSKQLDVSSARVMAYDPLPSEVDVLKILRSIQVKRIYVPQIRGRHLFVKRYGSHSFIPLSKVDVMIVPALFVEKNGNRLGRGGGVYDRLLKRYQHRKTVFLGYRWQLIEGIPVQEHDQRVSTIITD